MQLRIDQQSTQLAVPMHPLMWQMDGDLQEVGIWWGWAWMTGPFSLRRAMVARASSSPCVPLTRP